MKKILVIGSINMDISVLLGRVPGAGETCYGQKLLTSPGGKGANQAYAVAKLGGQVSMLGAVGTDSYGEVLWESLSSVGVEVSGIRRVPGVNTGTADILVEESGENRIVVIPGANAQVTPKYLREHLEKIRDCDILLMQLEIPMESVVYAAKTAKALGKTVILDPAPARADIPAELWQYVDYTKPNESELNMTLTGKTDSLSLKEALEQSDRLPVPNLWVTMGEGGVFLRDKDGSRQIIPAIRVDAVDTTAAGDTFLAAAAVSLARGEGNVAAAEYGNRAAAIAVTRHGAQQSIPTPEEVDTFFRTKKI